MKVSHFLSLVMENSKSSKTAPGELKKPSYDNLNTPDNHVSGKREVDGKKGLGDRKDKKPTADVGTPKKKAYDVGGPVAPVKKMSEADSAGAKTRYGSAKNENDLENADVPNDPDLIENKKTPKSKKVMESGLLDAAVEKLMVMTSPKFGRELYAALKTERPDLMKQVVDMFKQVGIANVNDKMAFAKLQSLPEALPLAQELQKWAGPKLRELNRGGEFDAWADKKADKLGITNRPDVMGNHEPEFDEDDYDPDSNGLDDVDEHGNFRESEEMAKPAVKTNTPAKSASVRTDHPDKTEFSHPDKKPDKNTAFAQARTVAVKKISENMKGLAEMGIKVEGVVDTVKKIADYTWNGEPGSQERVDTKKKHGQKLMKQGADRMSAHRMTKKKFDEASYADAVNVFKKLGVDVTKFLNDAERLRKAFDWATVAHPEARQAVQDAYQTLAAGHGPVFKESKKK